MESGRARSHLDLLSSVICCAECEPPVAVEIPVGVFYRLRDHDTISCPNGHRGSVLDYKNAGNQSGERCGPFVLCRQA
ncbi:MAG TPA: hypothetical protein VFX47_05060 [Gammaproteobacteria bacterium]|nr:hypothetical protein [Gammaproteobacteria bacterium]